MNVVITYDVSTKQSEIKSGMKSRGYMDTWTSNGQTYFLPNTTLWKKGIEPAQAVSDITAVAQTLGVHLERAVAVPSEPWSGIPGDKHR